MTDSASAAAPLSAGRVVRRAPLADLPFWPRYLSREEAARYLGVSVQVFDAEVRAGVWPPGRPRGGRGGRMTWNRDLLDAAAATLDGLETRAAGTAAITADASRVTADDAASAAWEARLYGTAKTGRAR